MAYNIQADTGLLKEKNNRLKQITSDVQENVTTVMNNVNRVNEGWTGVNSEKYVQVFTEFKKEMDLKVATLNDTCSKIDKTIQLIEEQRAQTKNSINQLSV